MSETSRERRWRRERRILLALTAAGLICAVTLAWLWLFPLVLQIKRVAVARRGAPDSPATKSPASRPIYPYSIIRGGAYSGAELSTLSTATP